MKDFLVSFITIFVLSIIFLTFGGYHILDNTFGFIGLVAFIVALFITAIIKLYIRIDALEKRLKELELKNKSDQL